VDEAIIYTGLELEHADSPSKTETVAETETETETDPKENLEHATGDEPTVQDVYDSMTPEQQEVVHYMVGAALESTATPSNDNTDTETDTSASEEVVTHEEKDQNNMGRNVFENNGGGTSPEPRHTLSHDAMRGIAEDAVKRGSLKEAVEDYAFKHGIDNIDLLFPDARNITDTPSGTRVAPSGLPRCLARFARARSHGSSRSSPTSPTRRRVPAVTSRAP
jgi:hypothetical protein